MLRLPTGIRTRWRRVRRVVLARRRLLAALLAAAAVATALRVLAPPPPPSVPVPTAARDLPTGAVLGEQDLRTVPFAPESVPDGLARDAVGRTIAAPLRRGEPVTDLRLVSPGLTEGYPGLTALPVRIPDSGAVALLRVGDQVDLIAADARTGEARVVASAVRVLALPVEAERPAGEPLPGALAVLGVAPTEVEPIAAAAVTDFLTVALSD